MPGGRLGRSRATSMRAFLLLLVAALAAASSESDWQSAQPVPSDTIITLSKVSGPPPPPSQPPSKPDKPAKRIDDEGTAVSITVVCVLLLGGVLLRQYMEERHLPAVTETGACMLLGAVVNGAFWAFSRLIHGVGDSRLSISMSDDMHDIIYYGLLPPIIFEAGFTMRKRSFFANFGTILVYAVVGTLFSIIVTGGITYALAVGGVVTQSFSFSEAMLFGSLISSTDPVATLGILKSVGAPPLLYDLVFGESALNDALSIVLFNIFRRRCQKEYRKELEKAGDPEGFLGTDRAPFVRGFSTGAGNLPSVNGPDPSVAAHIDNGLPNGWDEMFRMGSPEAAQGGMDSGSISADAMPSAVHGAALALSSAAVSAAQAAAAALSPSALAPSLADSATSLKSYSFGTPPSAATIASEVFMPSPPLLPMPPSPPPNPPWFEPMLPSMGLTLERLVKILPLSLLMGVLSGLLTAIVTKRLGLHRRSRAYAELSLLLVAALLTYTLTDSLELSGILSLFFAGITMRHYTYYNLSPAAQATARTLFATVSSLSDIALSLILGVALVDYTVHALNGFVVNGVRGKEVWDWSLIGCSAPVLLLARAVNIFPLSELANTCVRKRDDRISCRMQLVMWWSGLRGAISFALAITLDDTRVDHQVMPAAHAKAIATTTLAIIIGTNLFMAPVTGPLIEAMRLKSTGMGPNLSALVLPLIATGGDQRGSQAGRGPRDSGDEDDSAAALAELSGADRLQVSRTYPGSAPVSSSAPTLVADRNGGPTPASGKRKVKSDVNPVHRAWRILDQHYMKPLFGGRPERDHRSEDDSLNMMGLSRGGRVPPADSSAHDNVRTSAARNGAGTNTPATLPASSNSAPTASPP